MAVLKGDLATNAHARQAALHPGFVQAVIAHGTKHPGNDASRAAAGSVLALLAHTCDEARRLVAAQGDVTVDLMLSSLREVCDTICTADGGGIRGTLQLRTLSVLLAVKEQGGAPAERAMRDPHALLVAVQLCGPRFADADGGRGPALRYLLDAFTPPRGDLSCAAWLDLPARQPPVAEAPLLMHLVPHFAGLLLAPDVPGDARVGLVMLAYRLLRTPGLSPVITAHLAADGAVPALCRLALQQLRLARCDPASARDLELTARLLRQAAWFPLLTEHLAQHALPALLAVLRDAPVAGGAEAGAERGPQLAAQALLVILRANQGEHGPGPEFVRLAVTSPATLDAVARLLEGAAAAWRTAGVPWADMRIAAGLAVKLAEEAQPGDQWRRAVGGLLPAAARSLQHVADGVMSATRGGTGAGDARGELRTACLTLLLLVADLTQTLVPVGMPGTPEDPGPMAVALEAAPALLDTLGSLIASEWWTAEVS
ncbi:hypothetical protein MNEG_11727 [Monoraphidium neglectum]|uniref:Neurochondrin n=1 Tax=Monoraphidium neglectum TaxID=145388 RepID=A0A0D2M4N1_9CHLO|nr:hypothetical protein MNEG_11727 [Monoraphidium neglectum]KIY96236.1 hypothetical protein MNEG_11727 [Monoraphidium neglectum]|eukprot:XP_013895256.1 hypothetical protein MNEG_11727 [Monoraphidium neglectum]